MAKRQKMMTAFPKLKKATFNIATREGLEEVSGYEVVPGIGVHNQKYWGWSVTHTPSGLRLTFGKSLRFDTRKEAVLFGRKVIQLLSNVDWKDKELKFQEAVTEFLKKRYKVQPSGGTAKVMSSIISDYKLIGGEL